METWSVPSEKHIWRRSLPRIPALRDTCASCTSREDYSAHPCAPPFGPASHSRRCSKSLPAILSNQFGFAFHCSTYEKRLSCTPIIVRAHESRFSWRRERDYSHALRAHPFGAGVASLHRCLVAHFVCSSAQTLSASHLSHATKKVHTAPDTVRAL